MNNQTWTSVLGKIFLLALLHFLLGTFSFYGLRLTESNLQYPVLHLALSLLSAGVLSIPILRARRGGWRLVAAVFLLFYAVGSLLVALEAYYMTTVLSLPVAVGIAVDGLFDAAIFAVAAVALFGRLGHPGPIEPVQSLKRRSWLGWLLRIPLPGAAYVIVFIAAGALIFQPLAYALAPEAAEAYLGDFAVENPNAILGFQYLRGSLWALMTLPVIALMRRPRWQIGLAVALVYAVVMGLPNLVPNEVLPPALRLAHTVEVFLGNFAFGWVVVWILARPAVTEIQE